MFGWFCRKPRIFTKTIRLPSCIQAMSSGKALDDEFKYQKLKATLELVRELEFAGLLTYVEAAKTSDDRKTYMILKI